MTNYERLRLGSSDANLLTLKIRHPVIKPYAEMRGGMINTGIIIEMAGYSLDDVLVQLLEDYGDEKIIQRIKEL